MTFLDKFILVELHERTKTFYRFKNTFKTRGIYHDRGWLKFSQKSHQRGEREAIRGKRERSRCVKKSKGLTLEKGERKIEKREGKEVGEGGGV